MTVLTDDWRRSALHYGVGSLLSYGPYFALWWLLADVIGIWNTVAAGFAWFFSYTIVFFYQTRDRIRTMWLFLTYTVLVTLVSGVANDRLIHGFAAYTNAPRFLSVVLSALLAGVIGFFASLYVLRR